MASTALDRSTVARDRAWDVTATRRFSPARHWRAIVRFVVLTVLALFWAAPVAWMVLTSFKPEELTISDPPTWLPPNLSDLTLANYDNVLFYPRGIDLIEAFQNSLFVSVIGTAL